MTTLAVADEDHSLQSDNVGDGVGGDANKLAIDLTPTPQRRCTTAAGGLDDEEEDIEMDDSGNYSSSSQLSDGIDLHNSCVRYQNLLHEKEQSLFHAIQDVRKLRSELERLSKSEQWYKQELRQQKTTRLEALERLYTQERKYMQENQRLQRECVRLYAKCAELEQDLEVQKQNAAQDLRSERNADDVGSETQLAADLHSSQFEIEQHQALIGDQLQLIAVLRKQKRSLLDDLQRLAEEKDAKVMELQRALAGMELENTHMTSKCKQLLDERQQLEQQLQRNADKSADDALERRRLHTVVGDLREQLGAQEQLLAQREGEILELQNQFKAGMHAESNMDEVHRLSVTYHEELNAKALEVRTLKSSMLQLQGELVALGKLQAQNDEYERLIDNLNFTLEARQCELQHLQLNDTNKTQQIAELQQNLEHCLGEREAHMEQLAEARAKITTVEGELIALHERYASMCALCERTKFELQLREIEQSKSDYATANDKRDIEQLRAKLNTYLHTIGELSRSIATLESELDSKASVRTPSAVGDGTLNADDSAERMTLEGTQPLLQHKDSTLREQEDDGLALNLMAGTEVATTQSRAVSLTETALTIKIEMKKDEEEEEEGEGEKEEIMSTSLKEAALVNGEAYEISRELQASLQQRTTECGKLTAELQRRSEDCVRLRLQLLRTDAKLYKRERAAQQQQHDQMADARAAPPESAAAADVLRSECLRLNDDLQSTHEAKQQLEAELRVERENVASLKEQLQAIEERRTTHERVEQAVQTEAAVEAPPAAVSRPTGNVQLLQQALQQQNERVQQLNAAQQEWEELLGVLSATQLLEEQNRQELALKRAELEELNELFAEQNEELQQLQRRNYQMQQRQHGDTERMQRAFEAQLEDLSTQLAAQQTAGADQQTVIAALQQTNARLQQRYDDDFAEQVATHNKQLRALQAKVTKLQQEREACTLRLHEMEREVGELRGNREQRAALRMPELYVGASSSCSSDADADTDERLSASGESALDDGQQPTEDRVKILTRVLESEYRRKMKRYDVHISTLLGHVKALKRALKTAERKSAVLSAENASVLARADDLRLTKMHLEEMRLKYEQSQATVKAMQQQLASERKRYEASDVGKYASSAQTQQQQHQQNVTHEVANLIDDYKKLIQQSAATTHRLKTSAILELIQRSNQCVPNLHKLETSVSDLHNDVQQFLSAYAQQQPNSVQSSHYGVYPFGNLSMKRPSLMDELRAAEQF